ncbi:MAG TPA: ATP-binding protein [Xanthobacteraceae bacterium]|nr:ATP-binding protein [Xanthobacteraceae bacterium]
MEAVSAPHAFDRTPIDGGSVPGSEKATSVRGSPFLAGGGDLGALIRTFDWAKTPLGPIETWSQSLRMMVSFLLANRFPLLLWWGPHYISIYNDAYRPILGAKHPRALGRPVSEVWSEIWHVLEPLIDTPFAGGPATWIEDFELEMNRYGFREETHFTVAYSPVPDESAPRGIGGVLATVHEITEKVVGERRVVILRDLGSLASHAKAAEEACRMAARVLANHAKDIPFALLYLIDPNGDARLAGTAGVVPGADVSPEHIPAQAAEPSWPLADLLRDQETIVVDELTRRFSELPREPGPDSVNSAVVVPLRSNKPGELAGFVVAGVSPRLRLDHLYRSFFELMAAQISTSIANARAYEEERKRAEALAEIDRAKTAFFSNVSHEFRTPLTLMLGPLERALELPPEALPQQRDDLAIAHRSGLRLLRLVNTLLDFSRIEAGRVQASYTPVDLAALTAGLAGEFRAAIEKAGLRFVVECRPLDEPAWVDRDMWEKIVLNLLSNAFKFTLEGAIAVRLHGEEGGAVLVVEDSGIGIPPAELPSIFDRFHRVEGARGRTHEGTGIGLALVQELAKLHGGSIDVASAPGAGSTFTVRIPLGNAHLPTDRLRAESTRQSTALGAQPYVQEALRWLPDMSVPTDARADVEAGPAPLSAGSAERATVLVADDNADMRDYVARLLAPHYEVRTVADGTQALASIRRQRPDLLLSDVMMPHLDGFALVRAIRADAALADLPIVLLSARAGEAEGIEGLEAGADDYLVKPFGARELLARLSGTLKLARLRRGFEQRIDEDVRAMRRLQEVGNRCLRAGEKPEDCLAAVLDAAIEFTAADKGNIQLLDRKGDVFRIAAQRGFDNEFLTFFAEVGHGDAATCSAALGSGEAVIAEDVSESAIFAGTPALDVLLRSGVRAVLSVPLLSSAGRPVGMISTHFGQPHRPGERQLRFLDLLARQTADYLERRQAEAALHTRESQLRAYVTATFDVVYRMSPDWRIMRRLDGKEFIADTLEPSETWLSKYILPEDQPRVMQAIADAIRTKGTFELEHRVLRADGSVGWAFSRAIPVLDDRGTITEWLGAATDITLRKQHEEHQRLLIDELNHRVKNTLATIQSMAMQTLRDTHDVVQARAQFVARLLALAKAHDILTRENWQGAPLGELVDGAVAAHRVIAAKRFSIEGPRVWLSAKQALALSMALHELCTNAAKYGALSSERGRVRIEWSVDGGQDGRVLRLHWREAGGPPVAAPSRRGFGSRLLERGISHDLRGKAQLDFASTGVTCRIEAPLERSVL